AEEVEEGISSRSVEANDDASDLAAVREDDPERVVSIDSDTEAAVSRSIELEGHGAVLPLGERRERATVPPSDFESASPDHVRDLVLVHRSHERRSEKESQDRDEPRVCFSP